MYHIAGFFRDLIYYVNIFFAKKEVKEIIEAIFGLGFFIYVVTFLIAHFCLMVSDTSKEYCNWEGEKGISKIYNVFEMPARKTACWLWVSEEKPEVNTETEKFLNNLFKEENYVSCDNRIKKETK